jgi:hypothetical protein
MSEVEINVGYSVDKLITADVNGRGLIHGLYEAARKRFDKPLTYLSAKALVEKIQPGNAVIIATGYPLRGWVSPDIAEMDGPPGAVALARALNVAFNAIPVIIAPRGQVGVVQGTCGGAGLYVVDIPTAQKAVSSPRITHVAVVRDFPMDEEKAEKAASEMITNLDPAAVIALENPGMNEKGVYHSGRGVDISDWVAHTAHLFRQAKDQGILSIGVGDAGNELGMGVIQDYIKRKVPFGSKCICPCEAGIADSTATDYLMVATASNWAAPGLAAVLGVMLENPHILHSVEEEARILNAAATAGAGNISGFAEPAVDGIAHKVHLSMVEIFQEMMKTAIDRKRGKELLPWRGKLEQPA